MPTLSLESLVNLLRALWTLLVHALPLTSEKTTGSTTLKQESVELVPSLSNNSTSHRSCDPPEKLDRGKWVPKIQGSFTTWKRVTSKIMQIDSDSSSDMDFDMAEAMDIVSDDSLPPMVPLRRAKRAHLIKYGVPAGKK